MLPQIDISTYSLQAFWLLVAFSILYFIIHKFIVPAFEQILTTRQNIINKNIEAASKWSEEIAILEEQRKKELASIYHSAASIKKEALNSLHNAYEVEKLKLKEEFNILHAKTAIIIEQLVHEFKTTEHESCIYLAEFIIAKITKQKPNMSILKECYKRL